MNIKQFIMAYSVEQDRLRALVPEGYSSLRPVLRLNAEIRDGHTGYVEFNTAVEKEGFRGWLNIACWKDVPFTCSGKTVTFHPPFLHLEFTAVGVEDSCPAEQDNQGCIFPERTPALRPPEMLTVRKEFCDCRFCWQFAPGDASGVSTGKTLPACPTPVKTVYPRQTFTAPHAAHLPCGQVLGAYTVRFDRQA